MQQATTDTNTRNMGNKPLPLDRLNITATEPRQVEAIMDKDESAKKFSSNSLIIWEYVIIIVVVLNMGKKYLGWCL